MAVAQGKDEIIDDACNALKVASGVCIHHGGETFGLIARHIRKILSELSKEPSALIL